MGMGAALNAALTGPADAPVVVLLHGFGCGQAMWRQVTPALQADYRVLLLDLPGAADSDPAAYDAERHSSLDGYAHDVLEVLHELDLSDVTVVGHSVAAMIAVLAHLAEPSTVTRLVLLAPSACYLEDGDYHGGFGESDIDDLLAMMERNQLGWQAALSGMVAGQDHGEAQAELEDSFCRTHPDVALQFARVTFRGDNRADLARVTAPTLVIQVRDDMIAPVTAGAYVHEQIAGSRLEVLETRGHAPHVSDPEVVVAALNGFLGVPART